MVLRYRISSLSSQWPSRTNASSEASSEGSSYLTHLVLAYQCCGRDLQKICNHIASLAYHYIDGDWNALEDDAGDFLLSIYHKLPRLIDSFHYYGVQFDCYLSRYLHLEYRSFKIHKQIAHAREYIMSVSEEFHYANGEATEHIDIVRYILQNVLHRSSYHRPSNLLRILLIALKFSSWISKEQIKAVSKLSSIPYQQLHDMCERLRIAQCTHLERYNQLQERRNVLYSRILHAEYSLNQISYYNANNISETTLRSQLSQLRERLGKVNYALRHVSQYPSNSDIAHLLGIPKGTVDSALYFFKKIGASNSGKKYRELC